MLSVSGTTSEEEDAPATFTICLEILLQPLRSCASDLRCSKSLSDLRDRLGLNFDRSSLSSLGRVVFGFPTNLSPIVSKYEVMWSRNQFLIFLSEKIFYKNLASVLQKSIEYIENFQSFKSIYLILTFSFFQKLTGQLESGVSALHCLL